MSSFLAKCGSQSPGFEQEVVDRFSSRLLELARRQLPERVRRRVDPEDVLQSVYRSFFRRLQDGCFSFEESHDVWRLLAAMTFHKARNAVKFHQRTRRDVRRDVSIDGDSPPVSALEPSSDDVTILFGCLEKLLADLPERYREIVVLRLEGHQIDAIAQRVQRSRRTVLRVLSHLHELAARQLE